MTASEKLNAKIEAMTTEQLIETTTRLNLVCSPESIVVCNRVERELEKRLPEAEFLALLDDLELMLESAA
jgi:hypothetical protein